MEIHRKFINSYSHSRVVDGGCGARGPLQEVVELCLQLPELDLPAVGAVVDGLAQEGGARVGQAAARAVVPVAAAAASARRRRAAAALVI